MWNSALAIDQATIYAEGLFRLVQLIHFVRLSSCHLHSLLNSQHLANSSAVTLSHPASASFRSYDDSQSQYHPFHAYAPGPANAKAHLSSTPPCSLRHHNLQILQYKPLPLTPSPHKYQNQTTLKESALSIPTLLGDPTSLQAERPLTKAPPSTEDGDSSAGSRDSKTSPTSSSSTPQQTKKSQRPDGADGKGI
jgi:hypothetical protein